MSNINNCTQLNFDGETFVLSQNKIDYIDEISLSITEAQTLGFEIDQKIRIYKALGKIKE